MTVPTKTLLAQCGELKAAAKAFGFEYEGELLFRYGVDEIEETVP